MPPRDSTDSLGRYSRTANTCLSRESLGALGFLVVGGGALGNEAVKNLGLLGAGQVIIVDPDKIEMSNLSRSVFFRAEDCGRSKAETLRTCLGSTFPDTKWKSHACEIADVGYGALAGVNLILSCVDSDLARIEVAWLALQLNLPLVDAGLGGPDYWRGRVSFFAGKGGACFCCKLSPRRRRELLSLALSTGHSCWAKDEGASISSTPTMASIVGALQVDFGLQCLAKLRNPETSDFRSPTIEISLDLVPAIKRFVTSISPGCPFHHGVSQQRFPLSHARASARELLDSQNGQSVDLDWPICVAAGCLECGSDCKPMRRVAWLRKHGSCSRCGSHRILEQETLLSLDRNSAWADTPLVDLGLPDHHLYSVRLEGDKGAIG